MEELDLLGTSNEMKFECLNCGEHIPAEDEVEDSDVNPDDVVWVQKGIFNPHRPQAWWFCSMDCFTKYVLERVHDRFRDTMLFDPLELVEAE